MWNDFKSEWPNSNLYVIMLRHHFHVVTGQMIVILSKLVPGIHPCYAVERKSAVGFPQRDKEPLHESFSLHKIIHLHKNKGGKLH